MNFLKGIYGKDALLLLNDLKFFSLHCLISNTVLLCVTLLIVNADVILSSRGHT